MSQQEFIDAESNYSGQFQGLSFRDIVLNHLRKIANYASVEFHGGYWQTKHVAMGSASMVSKEYISDTRETYYNAVEYLRNILCPHFDEDMNTANEEYELKKKELYSKCATVENIVGYGFKDDSYKVLYKKNLVELAHELLRKLNKFLKRSNYLEIGGLED